LQADKETRPAALARLAEAAHDYAHLTQEIGDIQDSLRSHVESLAIWEKLVREHPAKVEYQQGLATIENCRGIMLRATGHPDQALESYAKALAIRERLTRENPSDTGLERGLANSRNSIGLLQSHTGHPDQALESHGKALAIFERLARDNPGVTDFQSDVAMSQNNIGTLQHATGHPDQALESYGKALAILERLARDNPSVTEFQSDLAAIHLNIGNLQRATGHPDQALESNGKALAIRERLARDNPSVTQFQSDVAASHNNIGPLQRATGHPDQARESHGKALAIRERLARDNPSVTEFQSDLARSHNNIGLLQRDTGHPDQALESYGKALAINERLAREHPESPDYASNLGATLNNMATTDITAKRFDQARDKLGQAISWQKKALAANPRHPTYRQFLRNHLTNLIKAANAVGNAEEARTAQRELDELAASDPATIALDKRLAAVLRGGPPKDNRERLQLAARAYKKKLFGDSVRLYAESLEADPKLADDRRAQHRYNAACSAALAAAGGKTTPTLPSPIKGEEKTDLHALKGARRDERASSSSITGEPTTKNSSPIVGEDQYCSARKVLADILRERPHRVVKDDLLKCCSCDRRGACAALELAGGAQQRTPRTAESKRSRANSIVLLQLLDVALQFPPGGPATKVELNHLQRPNRWLPPCPEADQQACDHAQVDLNLDPALVVGEQMAAAQNAFEPAEKKLNRPSMLVAYGHQLRRQVQPIGNQNQDVRFAVGIELVRLDRDDPHLLLDDILVVISTQAIHDHIAHHSRCLVFFGERLLFDHPIRNVVLYACDQGGTSIHHVLEELVVRVAAIHNVQPARLEHLAQLLTFGATAMRNRDVSRDALEDVEVDVHFGGTMVVIGPESPGHLGQGRQQAAVNGDQVPEGTRVLAASGWQDFRRQFRDDLAEQFGVKDMRGFAERAQTGPRTAQFLLNLLEFAGLLDAA